MIYILYEVKNGLRELWSIKSLVDFMLIVPLALLGWATAKAFGASLEIGIVVSAWVGHVGIRFFDIVEQAVRKALSLDKGKT